MKTYQVTKREGECLGPVNWDYDFSKHFEAYACSKDRKKEKCQKQKDKLKKIENNPKAYQVSTYAHCYRDIHKVGMFDGWPYWEPVPAVQIYDPVANKLVWKHFHEIKYIRKREVKNE